LKEKFCRNCHGFSNGVFCCEECKDEYQKAKLESPEARHTILIQLLDKERVSPSDPLRSLEFYRAILESGCTFCHLDILTGTVGISLDRIAGGMHVAANICGCCKTCNRLKSDGTGPGKHDGFSFEEMSEFIGPAVAAVRRSRSQK